MLFSIANFRIRLLRVFCFSLNEESSRIKNNYDEKKKKRLLLEFVHDYFILHATNMNDMLSVFNT